ncbi:MAG: HAMP domain-containing protein [Thiobacillus sp.]|nr:HAMP domain-containing protein [Thiobacillus sp.]
MSLRRKTILMMSLMLLGLALLLYLVFRTIMLDSYASLEQQITLRNLDRASNSISREIERMGRSIHDWSSWNTIYQAVQDKDASELVDNLDDGTFWSLNINLMLFVEEDNQLLYGKAVDLDSNWQNKLLPTFEQYIQSDPRFLRLATGTMTSGLLVVGGEPMIIASRPILHNDDSGPAAGTLIWGRHLGAQELADFSEALKLSLEMHSLNDSQLPADFQRERDILTPASNQAVQPLDERTVAGYVRLDDIYAQPTLLLRTTQDREIYAQGQQSLAYLVAALIVVGIGFGVGMLVLIERSILSPLARLRDRVQHIGATDDLRLPISGSDELAQVTASINTMLNTVSQSRAALQKLNSDLEGRVAERTRELEGQKSQLQTIMDTMGEGLVYSVDGIITYVNRAFVELLQYPSADLVGKPFALLNAELDPTQTPVFKTPHQYETRLIRRNQSAIHLAITATPINQADMHSHRVIIIRDITQERADKAQKDYFFARASHDLRSPLSSIMTRLYMLGKKPEQLDTHLAILNQVSNQMMELINDLLDISRLEQGGMVLNRRNLVLQSVVEQVVEVQKADAALKRQQLCADLVETPVHVYADPTRLNQVVTNLVSNAIHYTSEGGQIIVRLELGERDTIPYACLQVIDNGIGISTEQQPHIFDPFYRASDEHGGSGLGLYIVKEIVDLHGGEVTVESEVGKGTHFTVCLALTDDNVLLGGKTLAADR